MKDIHQPHDKFVGQLFENEKTAIDFLQHYLPPEVLEHVDLSAGEIEERQLHRTEFEGDISPMFCTR